jgi:hypothetical protein
VSHLAGARWWAGRFPQEGASSSRRVASRHKSNAVERAGTDPEQARTRLPIAERDRSNTRGIGMPATTNLPDVDTTTGPGGQVISVGPQVKVACFGDSLMWGQGLKNEQKFKTLIVHALRGELGKTAGIVYDRSRSGAKITGSPKDRAEFVETYPELFPGGKGLDAFKANGKEGGIFGKDEFPASALFGEVPSTYPTVAAQVELMSDEQGKTIDYVLLDGGLNDIGPEVIVKPAGARRCLHRELRPSHP